MNSSLLLAVILSLAPVSRAGGLDQRVVPRDARWVAHLDVEAMAKSEFLRRLREDGTDLEREFNLDEIQRELGVDPLRDLTSLTFIGCGTGEQDLAVVVRAGTRVDAAWNKLIESCRAPTRKGARNVYTLGAGKSALEATMASSASGPDRTIVLATSDAALGAALATLDGTAPALERTGSAPIAARPSKGAIFFAAGSTAGRRSIFAAAAWNVLEELAALERAEMDRVATKAQALVFELGEDGGSLFTQLALDGKSAQEATDMAQVLRGSLARASSVAEGTPAGTYVDRLARALRIEATGSRMSASFRYGIRELVADVARAEELLGIRKAR